MKILMNHLADQSKNEKKVISSTIGEKIKSFFQNGKKRRRFIVVLFIVLILIILLSKFKSMIGENQQKLIDMINETETMIVQPRTCDAIITKNGTIESDKELCVFANATATADSVLVNIGDYVTKGQQLIIFNKADINKEISVLSYQKKANYYDYLSKKKAFKKGTDSFNQLYSSYMATKETLDKQIDELNKLGKGVYADFNGVITSINITSGETFSKGQLLIKYKSTEALFFRFQVAQSELDDISIGQPSRVTVLGNTYDGKVDKIDYVKTSDSKNNEGYFAKIKFSVEGIGIPLGMEAKATITMNSFVDALIIPKKAVNTDREGDFCFIVIEGLVRKKYIKLGTDLDNSEISVSEGLKAGDEVIVYSFFTLHEGHKFIRTADDLDKPTQEQMREMQQKLKNKIMNEG